MTEKRFSDDGITTGDFVIFEEKSSFLKYESMGVEIPSYIKGDVE